MQEKTNPWQRQEEIVPVNTDTQTTEPVQDPKPFLKRLWEGLRGVGLGDSALRFATLMTTLILVLLVVWVMDSFYIDVTQAENESYSVVITENPEASAVAIPQPLFNAGGSDAAGVARRADLHTVLPIRQSRYKVL